MKADKIVTIWHYEDLVVPKRKIFKNVYIDTVKRMDKSGIKELGFFDSTRTVVRIPTTEEITVLPGDYLFAGESFEKQPTSEGAIKILEVKDNRRGGQKHWRIVCGE